MRTLAAIACSLALAAPVAAAPKPAPRAPGKGKAAPAKADPAATTNDPDWSTSGKVIEIAPDGQEKVLKGEASQVTPGAETLEAAKAPPDVAPKAEAPPSKPRPGQITLAESCALRTRALCAVTDRCAPGALPFDCKELAQGCAQLPGVAPYPKKAVEACAAGLKSLKCDAQVDFAGGDLNLEAKVPACKPVLDAEREQGAQAGTPGASGKTDFGPSDFSPSEFKPSDFGPSDFTGKQQPPKTPKVPPAGTGPAPTDLDVLGGDDSP